MTQFSPANWCGNEGDASITQVTKEKVFVKNDNQIKILKPKFVIPFASFSWFSHEENSFCNQSYITLQEFKQRYKKENVIVLYIDDEWKVGSEHDSNSAMTKWDKVLCKTTTPKRFSDKKEIEDLQTSFAKMISKIKNINDWKAIKQLKNDGLLEPCIIHLKDINKTLLYDITQDKLLDSNKNPDIIMGSESFKYMMDFMWGRGTLTINGRFETRYNTFYKFLRQTHIYYANNIGLRYPDTISRQDILKPKSFVYDLVNI